MANGVSEDRTPPGQLGELARVFLRLGLTAFGGPAAHIALMKQEFVERRRWLTEAEFLDLLGAVNLVPGPNSTELAMHIGLVRAGRAGLVVAGACFILPAALLVTLAAWGYQTWGTLPQVGGALNGVKPVIVAVVAQAIVGLVRPALKTPLLAAVGAATLALSLLTGANELALLFGAGAVAGVVGRMRPAPPPAAGEGTDPAPPLNRRALYGMLLAAAALAAAPVLVLAASYRPAAPGAGVPFGLAPLALFFLKVGATLYGSGYVLLAFLRETLVTEWRWLTEARLLDATAVGQFTPGPVFTTATFIGYVLGGPVGAALATVAIFLPGFLFVGLVGRIAPALRRSPLAGAFLDGVNAASLALLVAVTCQLAAGAFWTTGGGLRLPAVALAAAALLLLVRFRVNSAWLIAGGAVLGWVRWVR